MREIHELDTLPEHPAVPKNQYYFYQYIPIAVKEQKHSRVFIVFLVSALVYMSLVTGIILGRFFLFGILK